MHQQGHLMNGQGRSSESDSTRLQVSAKLWACFICPAEATIAFPLKCLYIYSDQCFDLGTLQTYSN